MDTPQSQITPEKDMALEQGQSVGDTTAEGRRVLSGILLTLLFLVALIAAYTGFGWVILAGWDPCIDVDECEPNQMWLAGWILFIAASLTFLVAVIVSALLRFRSPSSWIICVTAIALLAVWGVTGILYGSAREGGML